MNKETFCEILALEIMLGDTLKSHEAVVEFMAGYGYGFRKNKGIKEIHVAFKKAIKRGNLKTENELSWFALYLKLDVVRNK